MKFGHAATAGKDKLNSLRCVRARDSTLEFSALLQSVLFTSAMLRTKINQKKRQNRRTFEAATPLCTDAMPYIKSFVSKPTKRKHETKYTKAITSNFELTSAAQSTNTKKIKINQNLGQNSKIF